MKRTCLLTLALIVPLALASQDSADARAKLLGSWIESNHKLEAWVLDSIADGLHVTQFEGKIKVADFECKTDGRNCDVKIAGRKAEISMYYNGDVLVELETRGDQVLKRRFLAISSGNSMKVEVIPISGHVQSEQLQFEHGQLQAAK